MSNSANGINGNEKLEDRVKAIITDIASAHNEQSIALDANLINDLGIGSLELAELIMELQSEFGVEISDEDMQNIQTVQQIIDYIKKAQNESV